MSRSQLTSTVEQNTGGAVSPYVAGKNKIINGDFGIWQRGTTFTSPAAAAYTADRYKYGQDGTGTVTVTQQTFTPGTAPVAGYEGAYFQRTASTAAGTSSYMQQSQLIEDVRTFAGQTVTLSFWAKSDSARSSFVYMEQNFGSGGSSTVQYLSMGNASTTTSWQRFSFTVALSSISGKTIGTSSFLVIYIRLGAVTSGATLDIWGVQLEAGSVATPFTTATGTLSGELAACQRYYWRLTSAISSGNYTSFALGQATSTTGAEYFVSMPTQMRATPSLNVSGTYVTTTATNGGVTISSFGADIYTPQTVCFTAVTTGLVAGNSTRLAAGNNQTCYLEFNAEM